MLTPSSQLPVEEADKLLHTEQWVETTVNSLSSHSSRRNSNVTDTKRRKKDQRRKSGISATYVATNDYAPFQDSGAKPDVSDRPRKQSLTLPAINYSRTSLNLLREPDDLRFSKTSMINITGSDEYSEDEHHEDIDEDDDKGNDKDKDNDGDDDREEKSHSGYNDNINSSWRDNDAADVRKKKTERKRRREILV